MGGIEGDTSGSIPQYGMPQQVDQPSGDISAAITGFISQLGKVQFEKADKTHAVGQSLESADEQAYGLTDAGSALKSKLEKLSTPLLTQADSIQADAVIIASIGGQIGLNSIPKSISESGKAITALPAISNQVFDAPIQDVAKWSDFMGANAESIAQKVGVGSESMNKLLAAAQDDSISAETFAAMLKETAGAMLPEGSKTNPFLNGCAVVALTMAMLEMISDQKAREKMDSVLFLTFQAMDKAITQDLIKVMQARAETEFMQHMLTAGAIAMSSAASFGLLGASASQLSAGNTAMSQLISSSVQPTSQLFNGVLTNGIEGAFGLIKLQYDTAQKNFEFCQKAAQDAQGKASDDERAAVDFINQITQMLGELMKKMQVTNTLTAQGG